MTTNENQAIDDARKAIEKAGFSSLKAFADHIGKSNKTVYNWINGNKKDFEVFLFYATEGKSNGLILSAIEQFADDMGKGDLPEWEDMGFSDFTKYFERKYGN